MHIQKKSSTFARRNECEKMLFSEIIGQERIKAQMRKNVQDGIIPHAMLFAGPEGVGKLQLAIAYAQYLACPNRTDTDSCGTCPTCLQYQKLQHPDLHFVFPIVKSDAGDVCDDFIRQFRELILEKGYFNLEDWYTALGVETKQGMIYEKESSEILRKLSLKAFGDGYKVMIIWQPEKMNITCANKLLKLLEEPPEKTVFILVSEHPEMLLATILSRVQQVRIPRLSEEEIVAGLQSTDRCADRTQNTEAKDLARIAGGSYLAAVKMMEASGANEKYLNDFIALMRYAYTIGKIKDANKKFEALQAIRKWSIEMADAKVGRERQKAFLQYAQRQIRENFIFNQHVPEMNYQTADERAFSQNFAPFVNSGNVEQIMEELDKAERQIEQNGNAKMIFFDLCLQFIVLLKR